MFRGRGGTICCVVWDPGQCEQWQPIHEPRPVVARRYAVERTPLGELVVEVEIHDDCAVTLNVVAYPTPVFVDG